MSDTKPQLPATGGRPRAIIPSDLDSAYRLATAIAKSGLAPKGMDSIEQILVAILYGGEVGLPPMASVQKIAVINGRAQIWGDSALALVLNSSLCDDVEEFMEGEGDSRIAVCEARRKGKRSPIVRKFSVADAQKAGLWQTEAKVTRRNRDGTSYIKDNDSPWYRYPDRMLQMRARGFALRDAFPDILGGLYLREEIEGEMIDVTPKAPPVPLAERLAAAPPAEAGFNHAGVEEELRETDPLPQEPPEEEPEPLREMEPLPIPVHKYTPENPSTAGTTVFVSPQPETPALPDKEELREAYRKGFSWAENSDIKKIPPEYFGADLADSIGRARAQSLASAWIMGFEAKQKKKGKPP